MDLQKISFQIEVHKLVFTSLAMVDIKFLYMTVWRVHKQISVIQMLSIDLKKRQALFSYPVIFIFLLAHPLSNAKKKIISACVRYKEERPLFVRE